MWKTENSNNVPKWVILGCVHSTNKVINIWRTDIRVSQENPISSVQPLISQQKYRLVNICWHAHLLTAESLWHGAELWWRVFYLTQKHIHVTSIIFSITCKIKQPESVCITSHLLTFQTHLLTTVFFSITVTEYVIHIKSILLLSISHTYIHTCVVTFLNSPLAPAGGLYPSNSDL